MSYITVEVDIDGGKIVAKEPEKLPANGRALLTVVSQGEFASGESRPFGLAKGQFTVPDDFNEPLPEEILRSFEGK